MKKIVFLILLSWFLAPQPAAAMIYWNGLHINVENKYSGAGIPGFVFSVCNTDPKSKPVVVTTDASGFAYSKKIRGGTFVIDNIQTVGGYQKIPPQTIFIPEAGTGVVFKLEWPTKIYETSSTESKADLTFSGKLPADAMDALLKDQRFFIYAVKDHITGYNTDYFSLIPKGKNASFKTKDVNIAYNGKKNLLTFSLGPAYTKWCFGIGFYEDNVECVCLLESFKATLKGQKGFFSEDTKIFPYLNNMSFALKFRWTDNQKFGGTNFLLEDKGNQYVGKYSVTQDGIPEEIKISVAKKTGKFKITAKTQYSLNAKILYSE